MKSPFTFNEIIFSLQSFWNKNGCIILQPIDFEVGAATFHPETFVNAINSKKYNAAYTQISKRPSDIRYCNYSNRLPIFHQFQVILKPSPKDSQELYLNSLKELGIDIIKNDIRFIEDNWESPTLGAFGLGWEIWLNGMEVTQFTYFQQMGGIECYPIMLELAYGLERIAMHIQDVNNIDNIIFDKNKSKKIKYSDIYRNYEKELSLYMLKKLDTNELLINFKHLIHKSELIIEENFPLIAYQTVLNCSHIFNLLDSKSCMTQMERQSYINKIRNLSNNIAKKIKHEETCKKK
ncbi:MAG TPA: glycine--tRNA ligase subunit alpha [Candidatus Azoamicus sp. OHIO1]